MQSQKIGAGLRLAIVAGVSAGIAVSLMLMSGERGVQVVQSTSSDAPATTTAPVAEPHDSVTTSSTIPSLEERVTKVEERVTVVEKRIETTPTTAIPSTTTTAPAPTTTTTTLPDGKVTSIQVERLWDEALRSRTGDVAIQVTVSVDAPIYHDVAVLLRVASIWTASTPPTETYTDVIAYFAGGVTDTATTTVKTIAKVDRVESGGWRIECNSPGHCGPWRQP